jgi:hypothetical protein
LFAIDLTRISRSDFGRREIDMQKTLRTIRVRELPEWPPQSGGAYGPATIFPTAGEAIISEVFPVRDGWVTFHGDYLGHVHSYHYKAETEKIADELYDVVVKNIGSPVFSLGEQEIEIEIERPGTVRFQN